MQKQTKNNSRNNDPPVNVDFAERKNPIPEFKTNKHANQIENKA